jgi:uncharacterized membrane protein YdfJ with MMPL/SSD domain
LVELLVLLWILLGGWSARYLVGSSFLVAAVLGLTVHLFQGPATGDSQRRATRRPSDHRCGHHSLALFAAIALIPIQGFREIAFALCVGLVLDTLVARALLVPALAAIFEAQPQHEPSGESR